MIDLRHSCFNVALLCATLCASTADSATLEGKVVGISDGDTITVLPNGSELIHVRIMGIDAPEKKQAYGQRSKQTMSECAYGKSVSVEWNKKDRYGRTIGKVIADGVDCGLMQIESGMAWHYKTYAREQSPVDRDAYSNAEAKARAEKRGLWFDSNPVAPWDFRHRRQ